MRCISYIIVHIGLDVLRETKRLSKNGLRRFLNMLTSEIFKSILKILKKCFSLFFYGEVGKEKWKYSENKTKVANGSFLFKQKIIVYPLSTITLRRNDCLTPIHQY